MGVERQRSNYRPAVSRIRWRARSRTASLPGTPFISAYLSPPWLCRDLSVNPHVLSSASKTHIEHLNAQFSEPL